MQLEVLSALRAAILTRAEHMRPCSHLVGEDAERSWSMSDESLSLAL